MEEPSIQSLCSFASSKYFFSFSNTVYSAEYNLGAFKMYNRKTHLYVKMAVRQHKESRDGEVDSNQQLSRTYDDSVRVFPCRSFNFGPQTVTVPHVDQGNLAQGWCSITAVGEGHLVLWNYGLAITFPPGSTILIPSALLIHSNTPIRDGETCYTIVQYAAGGIFHWIKRGFMSEKKWLEQASEKDIINF